MFCLAVNSSGNLFTGGGGGLYSTTDNGSNWNRSITTAIYTLAISDADFLVAGTLNTANVYFSNNNGQNWNIKSDGLEGLGMNSLAINKSDYIFAGTDVGIFRSTISSINDINDLQLPKYPNIYKLGQNYPNPFNPSTTIEYQIPEESDVTLKVYDILGREVSVLVNGENNAGNYNVDFNVSNLTSGIYFYRIEAKSKVSNKQFSKVGKMILLK